MTVKNEQNQTAKPVIVTNLDHDEASNMLQISSRYLTALIKAGAVPFCLPPYISECDMPSVLEKCDGVLLIGGKDYDPQLWGEERQKENVLISKTRQDFDIRFARRVLSLELPVLGICGGHQLVNLAAGGTLFAALETQYPGVLNHWPTLPPPANNHHPVTVDKTGRLFSGLAATKLEVNSFHHLAVKEVGHGLRVVGRAPDGVIEALEGNNSLVFTVQWHPEMEPDNPACQQIFAKFVSACRDQ